ncbi:MAG TPA: S41 family peptidase [Pyrinomonadaceae bacterium]|nr:S41 family peptidase [Pyrinomonadaceae bacterium]
MKITKNLLFAVIVVVLLISENSFAQTNPKQILDEVFKKSKEISLYSARINWDELQKKVYAKAENAKTINDLKPAFETLLNGLGDKHGKISNAKDYSVIANFTDWKNLNHPDKRPREDEIWNVVNDRNAQFSYKILRGNVGYLKIVGIAPNVDIEAESKKIRAAVNELSGKKISRWIIDLRYNGGGNMHPMMAGIAPLVGDGIVGGLVNLKGEKQFDWEIKNGNFIYGGFQAANLPNEPKFKKLPKIAVLTSRFTVSSGEIVATTLKGRPNTKFFGESTGSYTTNNSWEIIDNTVVVVISTGIFADRNGKSYEINIPVDVEIPFKIMAETEQDECVIAAKKWLKN